MAFLRTEELVKTFAVFKPFWVQHGPHLRTETLVDALAVFITFWKQHSFFADRDTCGCLSGFHDVLEATWLL